MKKRGVVLKHIKHLRHKHTVQHPGKTFCGICHILAIDFIFEIKITKRAHNYSPLFDVESPS